MLFKSLTICIALVSTDKFITYRGEYHVTTYQLRTPAVQAVKPLIVRTGCSYSTEQLRQDTALYYFSIQRLSMNPVQTDSRGVPLASSLRSECGVDAPPAAFRTGRPLREGRTCEAPVPSALTSPREPETNCHTIARPSEACSSVARNRNVYRS